MLINKKLKKTNTKVEYITKRKFIVATATAAFTSLLFTSIVGFALFMYIQTREDPSSISKISYFIHEAVNQTNEITPTASFSDKLFINEAKLVFTKSNPVTLVHSYQESIENSQEVIYLSDNTLIRSSAQRVIGGINASDSLEQVPYLQACARYFALTFENSTPEYSGKYTKVSEKTLRDGRVAHIWKTSDRACDHNTVDALGENLVKVISSVESY